jgi:PKD repeat protein
MGYPSSSLAPVMDNRSGLGEKDAQRTNRGRAAGLFLVLVLSSAMFAGLAWDRPVVTTPEAAAGPEGLSGLYGVGTRGLSPAAAAGSGAESGADDAGLGSNPTTSPRVDSPGPRERRELAPPAAPAGPAAWPTHLPERADGLVRVVAGDVETSWRLPTVITWQSGDGEQTTAATLRSVAQTAAGAATLYSDAYEGASIDVTYVVGAQSLKEAFLLRERPAPSTASYLTFPFDLEVPESLDVYSGGQRVGRETLYTRRSVSFRDAEGVRFAVGDPIVHEAANVSALADADYAVSRHGDILRLSLRVPAAWLLAPERTYPVVVDPTISGADFQAEYGPFELPAAAGAAAGGDVAVGPIDGDSVPDAVFLENVDLDGTTGQQEDVLRYWVCEDLDATTGGCASVSPMRSISDDGWWSNGAGVALGRLDADPGMDAVFLRVDDGPLGPAGPNALVYWTCLDLAVDGSCALQAKHSLPLDDWVDIDAGVTLVDVDRDGSLDALFMAIDWIGHYRLRVCYGIQGSGDCASISPEYGLLQPVRNGATLANAGIAAVDLPGTGGLTVFLSATHAVNEFGGFDALGDPIWDTRLQTEYWMCSDLRFRTTDLPMHQLHEAGCGLLLGPQVRMDLDLPNTPLPGLEAAAHRAGGVAVFDDLPEGDANGNGALDMLLVTLYRACGTCAPVFRYTLLLDGFVEQERLASGSDDLPFIPFLVVHDPNGDHSYSCFATEVTRELSLTTRVSRTEESYVEGEITVLGIGGGGSFSSSVTQTQENEVSISHTAGTSDCSDSSTDAGRIGPGYGDWLVGELWRVDWEFRAHTQYVPSHFEVVNGVLVFVPGRLETRPVLIKSIVREASLSASAWAIRAGGVPREVAGLEFDLGAANAWPGSGEASLLRDDEVFTTGGVKEAFDATAVSSRQTVESLFTMTEDAYFALSQSIDLTVFEVVSFNLASGELRIGMRVTTEIGLSTTTVDLAATTITYHLEDQDFSSDGGGDRIRTAIFADRAYGTWHFYTYPDSTTSKPHEIWTAKADQLPPRLQFVSVSPTVLCAYGASVLDCSYDKDFTLTVELDEGDALGRVRAPLRRVDLSGDGFADVVPLDLTLRCTGTGPYTCSLPDQSTQGLRGMYVVDVEAEDNYGNVASGDPTSPGFDVRFQNTATFAVTEDGSAVGAATLVNPLDPLLAGPNVPIPFGSEGIDLALTFDASIELTDYSISAAEYDVSRMGASGLFDVSDTTGAFFGVVVQIEASQNVDDMLASGGHVVICIGYNSVPDGTTEESLMVRWYNTATAAWEDLPRPTPDPSDPDANVVCGESTHFSVFAPIGNWLPLAAIASPSLPVSEGTPLTLDGSGSSDLDGILVAYDWDFGDGSAPSTGPTSAHAFGDDGAYTVTLTVTDDRGGQGTTTVVIDVVNAPPAASYTLLPSGLEGSPLFFEVRVTDPGSDDLTLTWDFGDGTSVMTATRYNDEPANTPDPLASPLGVFPFIVDEAEAHAYGDDGVYGARVTVTDDDGGSVTIQGDVPVDNAPPGIALSTTTATVPEGTALTLSADVSDPGSDDIALDWDWGEGSHDTAMEYNDPAGLSDPPQSPWGTFPFAFTAMASHAYGDDVALTATLTATDDDGGIAVLSVTVVVTNEAPQVTATVSSGEEGASVPFTATATDPGSDDLAFAWDWDDGSTESRVHLNDGLGPDPHPSPGGTFPFTATDSGTHAWGDDGTYAVTLVVTDDDGGSVSLTQSVRVGNVPPALSVTLDAPTYLEADLAGAVADFADPGSDDVTLSWSWAMGPARTATFYNDGLGPDSPKSPWGTFPYPGTDSMAHTYGDNGDFLLIVRACDDDGGCTEASAVVVVVNRDPRLLDIQAYVPVDLTLRVAGERWHDVRLDVVDARGVTATVAVVRQPGSPDEQSATVPDARFSVLGDGQIVVSYTPTDDPPNGNPDGADPVQVEIAFADGTEVTLRHRFNVRRPGSWTWTIQDLRSHLVGKDVHFEVVGSDAGSDDLAFAIDFGDGGTFAATAFNDGTGPDPFPSPDGNPITATVATTHAYASGGNRGAQVTLTDDDGGLAAWTGIVDL